MAAPAYRIIEPTPERAPEIVEFHVAQINEQFEAAGVDPLQRMAHSAELLDPRVVAAFQTMLGIRLRDPNYYCRLVEQDAAVQGLIMAMGAGTGRDLSKRGVNELWNLEVAEHLRGQGVASELMSGFMTGPAEPTRFTRLSVLYTNIRARSYYENRWHFHPFAYDATMTVGNTSVRALTMTRWPDETLKEK